MSGDITKLYQSHKPLLIHDRLSIATCPRSGVYFWWTDEDGLRLLNIPISKKLNYTIKESKRYYLCYIGIGPMDENSKQPLFDRISTSHFGKRIYASTLRYSVASLLKLQFYVKPKTKGKAYSILEKDEEYITSILQKHFILSAIAHSAPWDVEVANIQNFEPPLNIDDNRAGWYYKKIVGARANSRKAALAL